MDHHDHPPNVRDGNRRALAVVLALTASFTVVEIIGGLLTGSLALLADAGHMLSDNLALGLLVNVAGAVILYRTGAESLNVEGAMRHILADALGSGGAMVAATIIILT